MNHLFLVLHLLGATIWVGGHLLLLIRYLPQAIKENEPDIVKAFEKKFEPLGLPALLLQIITGILLAYHYNVRIENWFSFSNGIEKVVSIKLMLLLSTLALAAHARIFIIPKLSSRNLTQLGIHILLINIIAIAMLVMGTFIRKGGL
ncbi:MAG: CopD family protein [Bacteroidia bacterium]|nr:CopD family protein [Bacteroidia bacterium]